MRHWPWDTAPLRHTHIRRFGDERKRRPRASACDAFDEPGLSTGPYRFVNRENLIVTYRTDLQKPRALVPEPLVPEGDTVKYEFIRMPDSTGFGGQTGRSPDGA